ncbi:MAG: fimbrial protein [Pasteurellaceae bacterium]|nr:fimbrial protein [Pasteurellaceae bacterium]
MRARVKFFAIGLWSSVYSSQLVASEGYYSLPLRLNDAVTVEYARDNLPYEMSTVTGNLIDSLLTESYSVTMLAEKVGEINGKGIYATSVKGIGFTLQINDVEIHVGKQNSQPIGQAQGSLSAVSTLVLYDKVPSGNYVLTSPQTLAQVELADGFKPLGITLSVAQPIVVKQNTCELQSNKYQQVQLQPIMLNELIQKKEVLGNHFNIRLRCDANVRADVVFHDHIMPTNTSDCLTLSPESTAGGVCIAIRREDNQKVQFGHTWTFSEAQPGSFEPERRFSAYYVKAGDPTAGKIKAIATISFTYH